MTKLERMLNVVFSRLIGHEGVNRKGFNFYRYCRDTQVSIVFHEGPSSFRPKSLVPPKTPLLVAGYLCPDSDNLILEFKTSDDSGNTETHMCLTYRLEELKLAASNVMQFLRFGVPPKENQVVNYS